MRVLGALAPQFGDIAPPTIPQNVVATAINAGRVDLTWTASTDDFGVAGYQIFRNGSPLNTTALTSYTDPTCQPSTFYSYVVVAFDGAGNSSAASTAGTATTPANAAPVWQSIPAQTLIIGNAYLLTLTSFCTDADLDTLTFTITAGTLPTGIVLSGNRLQGTPTTAGQTPTVTVQAADAFHQITTTIAFSTFTADVTAPPIPSPSAAVFSSSQINLTWSPVTDTGPANELVSGTQDYRVYRSTDGGANYSLRATTSSPSYSDTGLSASTTYFYKVTSRDVALNESARSSAVSGTTTASGVTTSVVAGVFTLDSGLGGLARGRVRWGQLLVNSNASKLRDLKGYLVSLGTTSGGTQIANALNTTLTTQKCPTEGAFTGLISGTTYHCFVNAIDSAGNIGAPSAVFSFVAAVYAPATRNYTGRHLTAAQSVTAGDWIFDNDFTGTLTVTQSNVYINGNGHFLNHGSGSHGIVINSGLTNVWIDGVSFTHASGTGDNIRIGGNVTNCIFSNNAFVLRSNAGIGTGENPLNITGSRIYGNTCSNQYSVASPDSGIAMVSYCNGFVAYGNTCTNVGNAHRSGMFGECGNCEVWGNTWSCTGTNVQSFFWSSFGTITSFIHDNSITIGGTADTVRAVNLDGPNGAGSADSITHVVLHNTFQFAAGTNASGPFMRVRNPVGPISIGFCAFNMLNGGGNAAISFGSNQSTGGIPCPFGGYIYGCVATNYGSSKPMGFYGENAWDLTLYMWDCDMGGEGDSGGGGQSGNLVCNNCTWPNGVTKTARAGGCTWDSFNTTVGGTNPFTTHASWFGFDPAADTPGTPATPAAVASVP
jgi:fibronectin type 3 domain-containing protein